MEAIVAPPVDAAALAVALRHADHKVRLRAATDMRRYAIDASEALPALIEATSDVNERVRREAVYSLPTDEKHSAQTIPVLFIALADDAARYSAAWKLAHVGKPVIPKLVTALDNPDRAQAAASALGSIGTSASAALPKLRKLAKTNDPRLRKTVEAVLKRIDR